MKTSTEKIITEVENYLKILGYSKTTYTTVYNELRDFTAYLKSQHQQQVFKGISKEIVSQYIDGLKTRDNKRKKGKKLSSIHINSHISSLKKLSEYLWEAYRIIIPITHLQRLKAEDREMDYLSIEEIKQLYKITHPKNRSGMRDRAMLAVYYGCGLRRSEGEALKVKDIDFRTGLVHIRNGKGRKERLVPMSNTVEQNLKEYIEVGRRLYLKQNKREQYLFLNERGEVIQSQSLLSDLKKLLHKANIDKKIGLHSLRHSIATHLLDREMELEDISIFLGHSSLESTQIYTHINEEAWRNFKI